MRSALVMLVVVVGCDKGQTPPKQTAQTAHTEETPRREIPAGPYVVRFDCFHSDQPFGEGSQYRNNSFDLGARTYTKQWYTRSGVETPTQEQVPAPVTSPLSDARVAVINTAAEQVLRGGPFEAELPVPEGTPCTLAISAGGKEVFKLEKAATEEKDAASALVLELHP